MKANERLITLAFVILTFASTGLLIALLSNPAQAEWYASVYGGESIPSDISISASNNGMFNFEGRKEMVGRLNVDNSPLLGMKIGYWNLSSSAFDLGMEVEGNRYTLNIPSQKVNVITTTSCVFPTFWPICTEESEEATVKVDQTVTGVWLNFLVRYRFAHNKEFPYGKIDPYLGAGVGNVSIETETFLNNQKNEYTQHTSSYSFLGGVKYFLTTHNSLFLEYKLLKIDFFEFKFPEEIKSVETQKVEQVYFGFSYHF